MKAVFDRRLLGWALVLALILAWEVIARAGIFAQIFFPTAVAILRSLWKLIVSGEIPRQLGASLANMFAGYFLAALVAIPLGIVVGYYERLNKLFGPSIELIRPLPATAIIPLALLLLGTGPVEKIFIVFFACSRTVIVNSIYGARSVDPRLIETARSYGYSGFRLVRRVVVPCALPQVMTGLRVSLAIAVVVIIGAEILGSESGIGYLSMVFQRRYDTPEMYACVVTLCMLGYVLNHVFLRLEHRLMGWYMGLMNAAR
jgi:NitT/TauT family transport system permease protein